MSDDQNQDQNEVQELEPETSGSTKSSKKSKANKKKAMAEAPSEEEYSAPEAVADTAATDGDSAEAAPAPKGQDKNDRASTLFEQGVQSLLHGEYDTAETLYGQALTLRRKAGDQAGQIAILEQLGHLCYLRGAEAQAREYYQQANLLRA